MMKKNLAAGIVAIGLIAAGGTGFYLGNVKENVQAQTASVRSTQMANMMNTNNSEGFQRLVQKSNQDQDQTFKQMLPFMRKMHPNLSDKQLKSLFESMHGANGAGCGIAADGANGTTQGTNGMMGGTSAGRIMQ